MIIFDSIINAGLFTKYTLPQAFSFLRSWVSLPFALEINYSYKGQRRIDYGVWLLMFKINWESNVDGMVINIDTKNVEAFSYYSQVDSIESFMPQIVQVLDNV